MAIVYNTSVVRSGLVLHLDAANVKSYPGSGTTWFDLSGNGNNGTIVSGEYVSSGYFQNAGNVTNEFRVTVADSTSISSALSVTSGGWTIEEVIMTYSVNYPEADAGSVASGRGYGAGYTGFDWNHGTINTQFRFEQANLNLPSQDDSSFSVPASYNALNTWKLRTMIWNRTSNVNSLYINGSYINQVSTPNTAGYSIYDGGGITFGALYGWRHFGRRTLLKIYNKILTTSEIKQNFEAYRGRYGI